MEEIATCRRCGAQWFNGQHRWLNRGNQGNELDLAGLVCNRVNDPACINPKKVGRAAKLLKVAQQWFGVA